MNAVDRSMKNIWEKTEGTVAVDRWKTEAMRWKSNEKKRGLWRNSKRERTRAGKDIERAVATYALSEFVAHGKTG